VNRPGFPAEVRCPRPACDHPVLFRAIDLPLHDHIEQAEECERCGLPFTIRRQVVGVVYVAEPGS
jgi:hypothetical protein